MPEAPPFENLVLPPLPNVNLPVISGTEFYFQKCFIYPAKANGTPMTANAGDVYVGKSGPAVSFTPQSMVNIGSVVRVTKATAHNLTEGASVLISAGAPAGINGLKWITNVTPTTFDIQLLAELGGPVTTLPTIARTQYLPDVLAPGDINTPLKYELPFGLKMRLSHVIVRVGTAGDGVLIQAW
jgi:hypothetical protein